MIFQLPLIIKFISDRFDKFGEVSITVGKIALRFLGAVFFAEDNGIVSDVFLFSISVEHTFEKGLGCLTFVEDASRCFKSLD